MKKHTKGLQLKYILPVLGFALFHACGFIFLAAWISKIITHNVVNIRNPNCGAWMINVTELEQFSSPEKLYQDLNYLAEFTTNYTAAMTNYVRGCYGEVPENNLCNLMSTRRIPWNVTDNAPCPFKPRQCLGGENAAFTVDTGNVLIPSLGINVKSGLCLRRQSTCAPIVMEPYKVALDPKNVSGYSHLTYFRSNITQLVRDDNAEPSVIFRACFHPTG